MINYNDGNWWGWNGGECPVHPETMVEVMFESGVRATAHAGGTWTIKDLQNPIIAFRVIKEHKEPRDFWVNIGSGYAHIMKPDGADLTTDYIHVREVI